MKTTDITSECILMVGFPGSGKSTYIKQLLADKPEKNYVVLSTDEIITALGDIDKLSYDEAFKKYAGKADKKIKILFRQAINTKSNVIIDRTNLTLKVRRKFLSQLPKEYHKKAIVFDVDRSELDRRLARREIETGKHIPKYVVDQMIGFYVPPSAAEFDEIIYV